MQRLVLAGVHRAFGFALIGKGGADSHGAAGAPGKLHRHALAGGEGLRKPADFLARLIGNDEGAELDRAFVGHDDFGSAPPLDGSLPGLRFGQTG